MSQLDVPGDNWDFLSNNKVSHPGWKDVTRIPSELSSTARFADTMFNAVLEQRYAYMPDKKM